MAHYDGFVESDDPPKPPEHDPFWTGWWPTTTPTSVSTSAELRAENEKMRAAAKKQDERILKLQQRCRDVRDAANKLVRGEGPALQRDCDEFERLVVMVNTPDLLELPPTIKEWQTELADAIDALQELHDWQNGPPLTTPKWCDGWGNAMKRATTVLKKHEAAKWQEGKQ